MWTDAAVVVNDCGPVLPSDTQTLQANLADGFPCITAMAVEAFLVEPVVLLLLWPGSFRFSCELPLTTLSLNGGRHGPNRDTRKRLGQAIFKMSIFEGSPEAAAFRASRSIWSASCEGGLTNTNRYFLSKSGSTK